MYIATRFLKAEIFMSPVKILYWIATIVAMASLYVGFVYTIVDPTTLGQKTLESCMKISGENSFFFSILCGNQHTKITLPIWLHLIPYLPAGLLLGLSWLLNINLRLPIDIYPIHIVAGLVWLGLIAAAFAIALTFWIAIYLIDKPPLIIFIPMIILSGWLIAPLLFQHLLAPAEAARHMSALKIGLVLMFITPVLAVSYSFFNNNIETLLIRSVVSGN
jgi:hypothetical protein